VGEKNGREQSHPFLFSVGDFHFLAARSRSRPRNAEAIKGSGATPQQAKSADLLKRALLATFVYTVKCGFSIWQAMFPARRKLIALNRVAPYDPLTHHKIVLGVKPTSRSAVKRIF
jgi:hypothetical protein